MRLSRALERDAIKAGYVDAWQHSNARRSPERRAYPPRRAARPSGPLALLRNRRGQVNTRTPVAATSTPAFAGNHARCQHRSQNQRMFDD